MFCLDSATVSFLVGGGSGSTDNTYVALCDSYGREIVRASGNDTEEMTRVEWDLTYEGFVGDYVFIKIVDGDTDEWGHITFDDFRAKGVIDENMLWYARTSEPLWDDKDFSASSSQKYNINVIFYLLK